MKCTTWAVIATLLFLSQSLLAQIPNKRLPALMAASTAPAPATNHLQRILEAKQAPLVFPASSASKKAAAEQILRSLSSQAELAPSGNSGKQIGQNRLLPEKGIKPFIIGGKDVLPGERTYQVSLKNAEGNHFCGGALIHREWVLTAAHCTSPGNISKGINVMVGSLDLLDPSATHIPVVDVLRHPGFDPSTMDNDVAILRLATPAPENLPLLKLADEALMESHGIPDTLATVSGWGWINNEGTTVQDLQSVEVPIISLDNCRSSYEEIGLTLANSMICAGYPEGGRDSCSGDSGGPLTVSVDGEDYSVGIVSWGTGECALPGTPGVYARTASVASWVAAATQTLPPTITPFPIDEEPTITATAGAELLYAFHLDKAVSNLKISLSGGSGSASLAVFNSVYLLQETMGCVTDNETGEAECIYTLAGPGTYLIGIYANTDVENLQLSVGSEPLNMGRNTTIDNIRLTPGQRIPIYFTIEQPVENLTVRVSGLFGDTDLVLESTDTGAYCASFEFDTNEECALETAEPGQYMILLIGYSLTEGATLTLEYEEEEAPPLPQAICQHQVIQQIGSYFIAMVSVTNISDAPLSDWYATWDYNADTSLLLAYNGIITSTQPYRAESAKRGAAIAPGSSAFIYVIMNSSMRRAENPTVTGNYCF